MNINGLDEKEEIKLLDTNDLLKIFPFGKTKLYMLLQKQVLPVIKIGHQYVTSQAMIEKWVEENSGKEIKF